jgi:SAM-dependent methyltransferase
VKQCPICESGRIRIAFRKNGYDYFRCRSCAMLLVDLHLGADEVFSCYSEAYYEAESSGAGDARRGYPSYRNAHETLQASFAEKLALVRRHVPRGRLLDAGAAYGTFLQTATPYFECTGIDVSEYAAAVARNEFGMNVQQGDLERTVFPDNHFDAIALWDIIEHLIHPLQALQEVRRILRPGGCVFISTDDAANWLPRLLGSHWWALAAPLHLCHFSKRGMTIAFQRAGLEPVGFNSDPRRYGVAEIIRHFGVSYQSGLLNAIGARMEQNWLGRLVFHIARPEQFIAVARKPLGAV